MGQPYPSRALACSRVSYSSILSMTFRYKGFKRLSTLSYNNSLHRSYPHYLVNKTLPFSPIYYTKIFEVYFYRQKLQKKRLRFPKDSLKGFSEFSISSLLYEKGTLYSAPNLLSFVYRFSLLRNRIIKEISMKISILLSKNFIELFYSTCLNLSSNLFEELSFLFLILSP